MVVSSTPKDTRTHGHPTVRRDTRVSTTVPSPPRRTCTYDHSVPPSDLHLRTTTSFRLSSTCGRHQVNVVMRLSIRHRRSLSSYRDRRSFVNPTRRLRHKMRPCRSVPGTLSDHLSPWESNWVKISVLSRQDTSKSLIVSDFNGSFYTSRNTLPTGTGTRWRRQGHGLVDASRVQPQDRNGWEGRSIYSHLSTPECVDPNTFRHHPHPARYRQSEWVRDPRRLPVFTQDDEPLRNVPRVERKESRVPNVGGKKVRVTKERVTSRTRSDELSTQTEVHTSRKTDVDQLVEPRKGEGEKKKNKLLTQRVIYLTTLFH